MGIDKKRAFNTAILSLLAATMVLAAFVDLRLSKAVFNPNSIFSQFFRVAGDLPLFASIPMLFAVLLWLAIRSKRTFYAIIFALLLICSSAMLAMRGLRYIEIASRIFEIILIITCSLIIGAGLTLAFCCAKAQALKKWLYVLIIAVLFTAISSTAVYFIKIFWGRTRFVELTAPDFSEFSAWYIPQGNTGHKSFPSGHTNSACGMLVIPLICRTFHIKKIIAHLLGAFGWAFVICTAASRIILGAHFLSDVTFAIIISALSLIACERIVRKYQKSFYTPE